MNDSEFDEFIRRKFREGAPEIPESYYQKVDEILAGLSEDDPKKKPVFRPKVAAILAVLFVVGATSAFAGVRVYQERLQSMSESEKKVIDDGVQDSLSGGDSYSRELTAEESRRMDELESAYRNGTFPEHDIRKVTEASDVNKEDGTLKYCYENSTFYLPDSEMTNEELLEIIDFRYKREYAVDEKNDKAESVPEEDMITEAEAVDLAKKYAKQLFHVTVDDKAGVTVEYEEGSKDKTSLPKYTIKFYKDSWDYNVRLDIVPTSGKWKSVLLNYKEEEGLTKDIKVNEKDYIEFEKEIWKCIDSVCNREEVSKITSLYYYSPDNQTLYLGEIKYIIELKDGSGYLFQRFAKLRTIYSSDYWDVIEKCWEIEDAYNKNVKKMGVKIRKKLAVLYQK